MTEHRDFTETQAAEELGVERLEIYLAAAEQKLGHYDGLTHLYVFSNREMDALAARLRVTRRRRDAAAAAARAAIPEPSGE